MIVGSNAIHIHHQVETPLENKYIALKNEQSSELLHFATTIKHVPMTNFTAFLSKRLIPVSAILLTLSGCLSNPPRAPQHTEDSMISGTTASIVTAQADKSMSYQEGASLLDDQALDAVLNAETSTTNDLWQRLRVGYQLDIADNPRLQQEMQWLSAHPDYLYRVSLRARPFLHYIVEETERRNMPLELALLPAVESSFQPHARSNERAAGLWQFIPATGKAMGLRRDWWYEGRYDITESTTAALDYLSNLARQFDGDWLLALAAYNAGPGTVRRSIRSNQKKGLPTDFWSLSLPRETRHYVPRLLAVATAVRSPEAFGFTLATIDDAPYFARVELPSQLDLAMAADLAGLTAKELKNLNPGLKRWATAPDGPHHLVLPIQQAETFRTRIAAVPPEKWVSLHRYRIRQGDTISGIAKRYGIDATALKRVNRLSNNHIRAGKYLLIPIDSNQQTLLAETANGSNTDTPHRIQHTVQPGDTLWDIARAHQVSHQQLAAWNGLSVNDTLQPGQTLGISDGSLQNPPFHYQVRQGDSLYMIARRFNVSIKDLKRWNSLSDASLQPGQKLTLYQRLPQTTAL